MRFPGGECFETVRPTLGESTAMQRGLRSVRCLTHWFYWQTRVSGSLSMFKTAVGDDGGGGGADADDDDV
jgi:hypothetical protein